MIRPLANITVFSGVLTNLYEIEQPPMGWSCNRIVPMFLFFHRDTAENALSKVHRFLPMTANYNKMGDDSAIIFNPRNPQGFTIHHFLRDPYM